VGRKEGQEKRITETEQQNRRELRGKRLPGLSQAYFISTKNPQHFTHKNIDPSTSNLPSSHLTKTLCD